MVRIVNTAFTQPLFDTVHYTANIEAAFAAVHRRRIEGEVPTTLSF